MNKSEIESLIDKKTSDANLKVSESRLQFALKFGGAMIVILGAMLATLGIIVPLLIVNSSSNRVDKAIQEMKQEFKELAGEQQR